MSHIFLLLPWLAFSSHYYWDIFLYFGTQQFVSVFRERTFRQEELEAVYYDLHVFYA